MEKDSKEIKKIQGFCQDQLREKREQQVLCYSDDMQFPCEGGLMNEYEDNEPRLSDLTIRPVDRQY